MNQDNMKSDVPSSPEPPPWYPEAITQDEHDQAAELFHYSIKALGFNRSEPNDWSLLADVLHSWKRWSEITGIYQERLEIEPDGSVQLYGGDDCEYLDCFENLSALNRYFITSAIAVVFERFSNTQKGSSIVENILNQEGFKP